MHRNIKKKIYNARHEQDLQNYMIKKEKFSKNVVNLINWQVIDHAGSSLPHSKQTWLTKHVSRCNATGRQMLRQKEWEDSKCPRCGTTDKDSNHIVTCPCKKAMEKFDDLILDFSDTLERINTCPLIRETIVLNFFFTANTDPSSTTCRTTTVSHAQLCAT